MLARIEALSFFRREPNRGGGASTGPRTPEGLQRIVKARTVHGAYRAEMRELRRLMRALNEERRRVLELVK